MKHFFIIGLPRSRTAWLANFLTNGDALCHHELMRACNSLDELRAKMVEAARYNVVGDADPTLAANLPQLMEKFPEAKFVFVLRPVAEAAASYRAAFPKLECSDDRMRELIDRMLAAAQEMADEDKPPFKRVLMVDYKDLDKPEICNRVHTFCLERPMANQRWELLDGLRVTAIAEKAVSTMAPWARVAIASQTYPMTAAGTAWVALVQEVCGTNTDAYNWLKDLFGLALTWDHLVDRDPLDLLLAEQVFEAMLLQWPFNLFWTKHALILAPVLSNALAAWRDGDRSRHYDVYSDSVLAVAFILGGQARVKEFSPRVRATAARLLADNDGRERKVS